MTHLIQFSLCRQKFIQWVVARALDTEDTIDIDFAMHHFLDEAFGRSTIKPFRVLAGRQSGRTISIYGYSDIDHEELSMRANLMAPPDVNELLSEAKIISRRLPDALPVGLRIGFDIKVLPVRRRRKTGKEVDAYTLSREEDPYAVAKDSYFDWMSEKLGSAVEMGYDEFHISAVHRKSLIRKGTEIHRREVTFTGALKILDGEQFSEILRNGVGRHKSYGMGMLLLRHA